MDKSVCISRILVRVMDKVVIYGLVWFAMQVGLDYMLTNYIKVYSSLVIHESTIEFLRLSVECRVRRALDTQHRAIYLLFTQA